MNAQGKNYIKVRDAEYGESGWAYRNKKGQVVLDNEFEYYRAGQVVALKDDGFTILSNRSGLTIAFLMAIGF